jgi:hypothetical protein
VAADRLARNAGDLMSGRLLAHGPARYEFRSDQDPSYYVKILTDYGERVLWGKGLERALIQGQTRPKAGDMIAARRIGREPVTVSKPRQEPQMRYRTEWEVEKASFFVERARRARLVRDRETDVRATIRAHPELKSPFLSIRSAAEFAARRIANPQDRERFLSMVRRDLAGSVSRGEPTPEVRLREQSPTPDAEPPRRRAERDDPTR